MNINIIKNSMRFWVLFSMTAFSLRCGSGEEGGKNDPEKEIKDETYDAVEYELKAGDIYTGGSTADAKASSGTKVTDTPKPKKASGAYTTIYLDVYEKKCKKYKEAGNHKEGSDIKSHSKDEVVKGSAEAPKKLSPTDAKSVLTKFGGTSTQFAADPTGMADLGGGNQIKLETTSGFYVYFKSDNTDFTKQQSIDITITGVTNPNLVAKGSIPLEAGTA